MKRMKLMMTTAACLMAVAPMAPAGASGHAPVHEVVAWSHYTGWEPWGWIQDHGTARAAIEKTCGKGSTVEIKLMNDYAESLNLYASGGLDGVAATTMDSLSTAGVGGVRTDMLLVTDYSDGNDAIIAGDPSVKRIADLKGKTVSLVQFTVSHYLLDRALEGAGIRESQLTVANKSDADIGSYFAANPRTANVVTWNPIVMTIEQAAPKARVLFTSRQVPGEIVDAMVVKESMPACAKAALREAWFEAVAKLHAGDPAMIAELSKQAGGSEADFKAQVLTTHFFWTPESSEAFVRAATTKATMDKVRRFSFDHGLYNGHGVDDVGISFPDGSVLGDKGHVVMAFHGQSAD